jgi:8-oxo-dGTP diphosphatase
MEEFWDIYDADRNRTGKTHLRGQELPDGEFHLVVEIWTINSRREILLTRRHHSLPFGDLWACTGGSATCGEDSRAAARRELAEEVGLNVLDWELQLVDTYRSADSLYDVWLVRQDVEIGALKLQPEEVSEARWVTVEGFREMYERNQVVPKLSYLYDLIAATKIPVAGPD